MKENLLFVTEGSEDSDKGKEKAKRLWKRFEDAIAAIYFARAGKFQIAKDFLHKGKPISEENEGLKHKADLTLGIIDNLTLMAITFAEAGEFKMAWELLNEAESSVKRVIKIHQKNLNDLILTPQN